MSRIAITPGEPAGIGPDLLVQLAQQPHPFELVVIADPQLLQQRAKLLGLPLTLRNYTAAQSPPHAAGSLTILPVTVKEPVIPGQLNKANSLYVLQCLDEAVTGCQAGEFAAMVTGPVHKGIINEAGIAFTGHTEYLANKTGTEQVVMMLTTTGRHTGKYECRGRHDCKDAGGKATHGAVAEDAGSELRVALATTHLPLRDVSQAITRPHLQRVLTILHQALQTRLGIAQPRILVCGLNPHAGEQGHLGKEELTVIEPVIHQMQQQGMALTGPLPADTLFTPSYLDQADAVLAMYHDQGLPVLKHMGFGQAVNVTLGLPIIRTSVDHGTALELAGTGQAHGGSLEAALQMALEMARHSHKRSA